MKSALKANGKCHRCGNDISHKNSGAIFCSNKCRMQASRERKVNEMEQLKVLNDPLSEWDLNDAKTTLFRQIKNLKDQAERTAESYKNNYENEREKRLDLQRQYDRIEDKLDRQKSEHNFELEKQKDKYERELEKLQESSGLGAITKEVLTPEVIQSVTPTIVEGIFGLFNKNATKQADFSPVAELNEDSKILLSWYENITPEIKKAFDTLLLHIDSQGVNALSFLKKIIKENGINEFEFKEQQVKSGS